MKKVKINRSNFELSFELGTDETTAYLDTEGGTVVLVEDYAARRLENLDTDEETLEGMEAAIQTHADLSDWEREQMLAAARIEWDDANRYRPIPKQDSQQGYREMQEFIWSLDDERLRELLEVAIQGSGAFRRFKDVLYRYPEAQAEWFKFRDERQHQRMRDWFAQEDIEPEFD
ncbi:MAG: UPF0158 family protein [Anaerolineae bacterium]|nr:UPF0158 family protein [Anaerolineae bacterium]NUQ07102.1 hypothetical protein [Anaerolineae bacterium]